MTLYLPHLHPALTLVSVLGCTSDTLCDDLYFWISISNGYPSCLRPHANCCNRSSSVVLHVLRVSCTFSRRFIVGAVTNVQELANSYLEYDRP
jgi:hypothetical protein